MKKKTSPEQIEEIKRLAPDTSITQRDIARRVGVTREVVQRYMREMGLSRSGLRGEKVGKTRADVIERTKAGMTPKEIAADLGLTVGSVQRWLNRVRMDGDLPPAKPKSYWVDPARSDRLRELIEAHRLSPYTAARYLSDEYEPIGRGAVDRRIKEMDLDVAENMAPAPVTLPEQAKVVMLSPCKEHPDMPHVRESWLRKFGVKTPNPEAMEV